MIVTKKLRSNFILNIGSQGHDKKEFLEVPL
jgi:hypothetical protein